MNGLALPVEPPWRNRYGDGLAVVRRLGLHDRHGLIVIVDQTHAADRARHAVPGGGGTTGEGRGRRLSRNGNCGLRRAGLSFLSGGMPRVRSPAKPDGKTSVCPGAQPHRVRTRLKVERLTEEHIGNSVHFIPVYRHPFFRIYGEKPGDYPRCESYFSRCISLPIYPDMTDRDIDDVVAALDKIATYYRRSA